MGKASLFALSRGWSLPFHGATRISTFAALLVMATLGTATAAAPSRQKTPILVIEAHTGERPGEIAPLIATLNDELETRGFAAHATTILHIATGLPRPGILDKDVTAAQIAQNVDNGYDLFTKARYREAVVILLRAIEAIRRNPALIVLNTSNSDTIQKAYISLALCQAYLGDAGWTATMSQEIRMFPTRSFPRADYGPNDETFYKKVYRKVQTMGRGRLLVATGNRQAVVFVEGQIRGVDKVELADLIPGTYHVFVQVPGTPGFRYEIDVVENDDAFLNAGLDSDCSLWATDTWIGFRFASEAARDKEPKCAGQVAARWSNRDLVGVVGTVRRAGRLLLRGAIYTTDGTMLRRMDLDVQTATPVHLRQLARLMAEGGAPSDGIVVVVGQGMLRSETPNATPSQRTWPKWLATGGSAAMLAVGGYAVYKGFTLCDVGHPGCSDRGYKLVAATAVDLGVSLGALSVYCFYELKPEQLPAKWLIIGGTAGVLIGAGLYAVDQDTDHRDSQGNIATYYWDTAIPGVALGVVGLASVGVGIWSWNRKAHVSSLPAVSVTSSRVVFGWRGLF